MGVTYKATRTRDGSVETRYVYWRLTASRVYMRGSIHDTRCIVQWT